ncbi:MAG: hypothetical protein LH618_16390, partial [Saprospiraceae bacterium]|nr:hypothetical protein [Saprospiraceae bacterium]
SFVSNEPFLLCFGTTAAQTGQNFSIKFEKLAEDSRCPTDVVCVWEGRALIGVTITHEGTIETDSLAVGNFFGMPYSDSTLFAGYKIKLLEVLPAPISTNQPTEADYKVKLLITN